MDGLLRCLGILNRIEIEDSSIWTLRSEIEIFLGISNYLEIGNIEDINK